MVAGSESRVDMRSEGMSQGSQQVSKASVTARESYMRQRNVGALERKGEGWRAGRDRHTPDCRVLRPQIFLLSYP